MEEKINDLNATFNNFDEINYLENKNEKLLEKIESLERMIPILETEIINLDKINISIKSDDCFSSRNYELEFDELNLEWIIYASS